MDGTGEHYAKWNKPGGVGQMPYEINKILYKIVREEKSVMEVFRQNTVGEGMIAMQI